MSLFTIAESYLVSFISSNYDSKTVLIAGALTAGVTVSLTIYVMTTKTDFTMKGGIIFIVAAVFMITCILAMAI